jgi:hypothetical protein
MSDDSEIEFIEKSASPTKRQKTDDDIQHLSQSVE